VSERRKRIRYMIGRRREKTPTQELAARLAPLEETETAEESQQAMPKDGRTPDDTIRVDTSKVKVPDRLTDEDRHGASIFHLEPVVVLILALMLGFIAFIAWQVTLMPAK
jgi:hypothetical protein